MKWLLLAAIVLSGCGQKSAPAAGSSKLTLFGTYTSVNPATPNLSEVWELKSSGEYSKMVRNAEGRPIVFEEGDFTLKDNWFHFALRRTTTYRRGVVHRVHEVKNEDYTILVKQEGDTIILDPEDSTIFGRQVLTPTN